MGVLGARGHRLPRKPGTANPLGGEFTLTHTISIPSSAGSWYESGPWTAPKRICLQSDYRGHTPPQVSTSEPSPQARRADTHRSRVQFSHSGGYGFDIIRWKIYKGNDLSCTRNGQSFSHTFGTPGYYYIYAIPIDRCGKEGPQKSLTVTVEERSTDCSSPYGRQGDYHCKKGTQPSINVTMGRGLRSSINPRGVVTPPPPTRLLKSMESGWIYLSGHDQDAV